MAATQKTTKSTGAAAKVARQSKLSPVRNDEQQTQEQPTVNTQQPTLPVTEQIALADLKAQKRALDEQIKSAKANQPKVEKQPKPSKTLHDVVERQAETIGIGHVLYIASRAMTRVKMGQSVDDAVNEVARRESQAAMGAIDLFQTGDYPTMRAALMHWCEVNAPLTVVKQRTQVSEGDESSDTTGK